MPYQRLPQTTLDDYQGEARAEVEIERRGDARRRREAGLSRTPPAAACGIFGRRPDKNRANRQQLAFIVSEEG